MARVLIIDQDRMIAAIERDFLETNGFDVAVAMTGKEGIELLMGRYRGGHPRCHSFRYGWFFAVP